MRTFSAAIAATLMCATSVFGMSVFGATAALADPVGRYSVEGINPGSGTKYTGTVNVEQTGETYRVTWVVGDARFIGTGIGDKNFLAVSYKSGDSTGLALYGADTADWTGVWAYSGGTKMGAEKWTRK